jgi:hypothetical protein
MKKHIVLISVFGVLGLIGSANVQAPSAAGLSFDGTYRVVSSTRVNQMYTSYNGQRAQCPNRKPGPLHIVGGRAHYMTATGYRIGGVVGPQGELTMRSAQIGGSRPFYMNATGNIDASGTAHARQSGASCSYDFAWQKSSK